MPAESPLPVVATKAISSLTLVQPSSEQIDVIHNCAIIGVYAPGNPRITDIAVDALIHLNHRGQEGAGLWARGGGKENFEYKGAGLATQVFPRDKDDSGTQVNRARKIDPRVVIAQDRYSTSGTLDAWQPFVDEEERLAVVHNGNITNAMQLLEMLPPEVQAQALSDTWVAHQFILNSEGDNILEKTKNALPEFEGAYSLIMESDGKLIGARDPWGMRPMVLGRLQDEGGWILASEEAALAPLGAKLIRNIDPGEMVVIDEGGVNTVFVDQRVVEVDQAMCSFEPSYIQAPDSFFEGRSVDEIRREMGRIMAKKDAEEGYCPEVIGGIQESGVMYAEGYHEQIIFEMLMNPERFGLTREELPYKLPKRVTPLVKNAHAEANRAFMKPNNRKNATELKHRPSPAVMSGKRTLFFDDSIVRLTTMRSLMRMAQGAHKTYSDVYPNILPPSSIDVRIGFPLIKFVCNWGVDFQNQRDLGSRKYVPEEEEELIDDAGRIEHLRKEIGASTLRFPTPQEHVYAITGDREALSQSTEHVYREHNLCGHCITGIKPTPVRGLFVKTDANDHHH